MTSGAPYKLNNEASIDRFGSIRPYYDAEVRSVLDRLLAHPELIRVMTRLRFRWAPEWINGWLRPLVRAGLKHKLNGVESVAGFQQVVERYMTRMIESTTGEFTVSGLDELDPTKPVLFLSNHRDIALDPAFINYALYHNKRETVRIAIGDNLLIRDYVGDLMRLNKSFIVKRSVKGPRQMMAAYRELSDYVYHSLVEERTSVWIAHREGRAKDGWDRTEPAIVKMLCMSKDKRQSVGEHLAQLNVVPVSISYEWDPCDAMKARELYLKSIEGQYTKAENEDVISIGVSISEPKGAVHVSFGQPLSAAIDTPEQAALAIDQQILELYRLHPSNLAAYRMLHGAPPPGYVETAAQTRAERVMNGRLESVPEAQRPFLLAMYANPIENRAALAAERSGAC